MSNKTKRLAKGLGASALAVATIASGLSFGASSASATPMPHDLDGLSAVERENRFGQKSAGVSPIYQRLWGTSDISDGSHVERKPFLMHSQYSFSDYVHPAGNADYAEGNALRVSSLSADEWRLLRSERSANKCFVANRFFVSMTTCDVSKADQWFKLENGRVMSASGSYISHIYDKHSSGSNVGRFQLTSDPSAVTIDLPDVAPTATLSGTVSFGSVDERATVSGTTEANGRVEVRRGSTVVGSATADANGDYSVQIAAPNKAGDDKLTVALVVDGADKKTIDVTAAYGAGVAITDPTGGTASGQYEIRGTAQAGASVSLQVNGGQARPVTVSANGQWSERVTLPMGETKLTATQMSKGANTTTSTVVVNEGESSVPAPTATVRFPENVEQRAVMTGTGAPGAKIEVFDGTQKVGSATVNTNGNWSTQLLAVGNGVRELTVIQTLDSTTQQTTIDADYGTELTVTTPAPATSARVTLTGTGTPGAKIEFRDGTNTVRTVHAAADGTWSSTGTFRPGTTQVRVASLSKGAVVVRKDTTVDVTIATRPLELTSPTKDDADNDRIPDGNVTFTGTATPYATIQFDTAPNGAGRVVFTTTADANGNWSATGWFAKSHYMLTGTQTTLSGDKTSYTMFPFSTIGFRALTVEGPTEGDVVIAGVNTFTGTASMGATVEVKRKDNGHVIARGTANGAGGTWSAKSDLRAGFAYQLEAVQTAVNGRTDTVDLGTITPVTSQGITDLAFTHDGTLNGNNITFTFKAQPGAEVSVWTGPKDQAGTDKPWIREMAAGVADKYGHVTIAGYAAPNNPYNLKVYAGTTSVDYTITTTPTK